MPPQLNVLLIEDNAEGAAFIGRLLQREGQRVVMEWAQKWQTGLNRLEAGGLDVALINLEQPEVRGVDALRQARARNPEVPIVVLSALDDVESATDALREGAQGLLVKEHITADLLFDRIDKAVGQQDGQVSSVGLQDTLSENEARLRAILNASLDCIITMDADGIILDFNPMAERTFGYDREEVIGKEMGGLLISEETRERQRRNLEDYKKKGEGSMLGRRVEATAIRKDGEQFIAEMGTQPVPLRGSLVFTVFLRDITEQKQAEQALKHYSAELERSNRDLDQYASIVSHDLAAPLRAMTGFCELLERDYGGQLGKDADEYIEFIVQGAKRMQALIGDLRSYARITTDVKPFERLDCQAVLNRALEILDVEIIESGTLVTNDPLPVVTGDKTQLTQLFQNLIANAIKYRSDEPPQIHISADNQGNCWQFCVEDNGIGIEPSQRERVFEIFQRAHNDEKSYSGTGIGLAICKRVVQRHNGRIWVESTAGEGSRFYFTFPIPSASGDSFIM